MLWSCAFPSFEIIASAFETSVYEANSKILSKNLYLEKGLFLATKNLGTFKQTKFNPKSQQSEGENFKSNYTGDGDT
jgi:hypothetical protein